MSWLGRILGQKEKETIPDNVQKEIFSICSGESTPAALVRLKAHIEKYGIESVDHINKDDFNPFMLATWNFRHKSCRKAAIILFEAGSGLLVRNSGGYSILLGATVHPDFIPILKMAVISGGNVDEIFGPANDQVNTALGLAIRNNNLEAVDYLLKNGANPNLKSGQALRSWGMVGFQDVSDVQDWLIVKKRILDLLVEAGADTNNAGSPLNTLLDYLKYVNEKVSEDLLRMLLDAGAEPRKNCKYHNTTLHHCGDFRLINIMAEYGFDAAEVVNRFFTVSELVSLLLICNGPLEKKFLADLRITDDKLEFDKNWKFVQRPRTGDWMNFQHVGDIENELKKLFCDENRDAVSKKKIKAISNYLVTVPDCG